MIINYDIDKIKSFLRDFHNITGLTVSIWDTHFGITIGKYIVNKRMEKAAILLVNSEQKIYDVCTRVGVPDYNYFTKVFKKHYSLTPKDYRKQKKTELRVFTLSSA